MHRKLFKIIRGNILAGIFLSAPIVATYLIVRFLFRVLTNWMPAEAIERFLPPMWVDENHLVSRLIILLLALFALYLVGLLTRNLIGRKLYHLSDAILEHIPVVKNVYVAVRQISEALFTQRKTMFKEVVMLEYPRKGLHSVAFVTNVVPDGFRPHLNAAEDEECVSVFVPTTPNPTSGVLILAPRSQLTTLDIDITDALTYVMSGGAVDPGSSSTLKRPTLLDKLEEWLIRDDPPQELPDGR